jgi:hypothetical protein
MGLPKALLVVAVTLFVASVLGTLAALGVFFWYDTDFWDFFVEPGPILKVAAVILSGLTLSSGLLFVHCRSQESYLTFEAIFFLVCFGISLVNLLLILPALFFLERTFATQFAAAGLRRIQLPRRWVNNAAASLPAHPS